MPVVFSRFHRDSVDVFLNLVRAKDALAGAVRTPVQQIIPGGVLGRWQAASSDLRERYDVAPEVVVNFLFFTTFAGLRNGYVLVGTSGPGSGRIARVTGVLTRESFGGRIGTFYVILCEEVKP